MTKVSQKPKITKKSNAKPSKVGGRGAKGVQQVNGLSRQDAKTSGKGGGKGASLKTTNPTVTVREYPGEGKSKGFDGVKIVGHQG